MQVYINKLELCVCCLTDSAKSDAIVVNMLFRGRIALDNLDIENIEDGTKDFHSHGVSVYNGWKVCKMCMCTIYVMAQYTVHLAVILIWRFGNFS